MDDWHGTVALSFHRASTASWYFVLVTDFASYSEYAPHASMVSSVSKRVNIKDQPNRIDHHLSMQSLPPCWTFQTLSFWVRYAFIARADSENGEHETHRPELSQFPTRSGARHLSTQPKLPNINEAKVGSVCHYLSRNLATISPGRTISSPSPLTSGAWEWLSLSVVSPSHLSSCSSLAGISTRTLQDS